MDPLSLALQALLAALKLHQTVIEGMNAEQRVEYGKFVLEDLRFWHGLFAGFKPKP